MSTTRTTTDPPTFVFGRRDRGGILLGFRPPQLLILGLGVAVVFVGLVTAGGRGGLVGTAVLVTAVAAAVLPIQGRPLVDWVRPVLNFGYQRLTGQGRYLGGPWALHRNRYVRRLDLPGLGRPLKILQIPTTDGPIAALKLHDRWTVLVEVHPSTYVLADRASQERRVAAWGSLLAQCGQEGSKIAGLQWLERSIPDSGHALEQWWDEHGNADAPYAAPYRDLIGDAGPAATRHEIFIAVSIDSHHVRRQIRLAGGGPEGATQVLLTELAWIRQALSRVDLEVTSTIGVADLTRLIRTQFDPAAACGIDRRPTHKTEYLTPVAAGPMAADASWSHYRTDSGVHAVYWVAEWPSMPVEAAWCYPLLALGGITRTISVSCEPIPPSKSLRKVRSQRVTKRADEAQRRRFGQVDTAQDDEEYDAIERRERELVHGHTEYRFTGWVTVSAESVDALEAACAQVEQAAVRSALELRRVHGEVDQAFAVAALPLNQGVR
ncbi:MAG: SCO6880 family protein [Nocardioidaceae bacterium]